MMAQSFMDGPAVRAMLAMTAHDVHLACVPNRFKRARMMWNANDNDAGKRPAGPTLGR